MFGSRGKGSNGELEVVALIEPWWRQLEPKANFARVPLSGGWGRPEHREGFQAAGDIMCDSKTWPWSVEVKRRENWTWDRLIAGKKSPVWEWWRQTQKAACEMKKIPILFFRHNREQWYVMSPAGYLQLVDLSIIGRAMSEAVNGDQVTVFRSNALSKNDLKLFTASRNTAIVTASDTIHIGDWLMRSDVTGKVFRWPESICNWTSQQLRSNGVKYGVVLPACYAWSDLEKIHPKHFVVKGSHGQEKRTRKAG